MNDPRKSYRGYLIISTCTGHFQYAGLAEVLPFRFTQDAPQELTCAMKRGIVSIHLSTMHFGNQDNLCVRIELADQLVAFIMAMKTSNAALYARVSPTAGSRIRTAVSVFTVSTCNSFSVSARERKTKREGRNRMCLMVLLPS